MVNTTSKRNPKAVTPVDPWVKGLYPGVHTAMNGKAYSFTPADVTAHVSAVQAQLATGYMPPLVKGHPKHDDPRVGSVVGVKEEKGAAWYKVDNVSPEFAESVQKGEYPYTSPALKRDKSLRHLGALGAWPPALQDQTPLEFGEAPESDEDLLAFGMPAEWGTITGSWLNELAWPLRALGSVLRNMREAMIEKDGVEAANKVLPTHNIEQFERIKIPYNIAPESSSATASPSFGAPENDSQAAPAVTAPADDASAAATAPATAVPETGASEAAPAATATAPEVSAEAVDPKVKELQDQLDEANRKLAQAQNEATEAAFGERLDKATKEGRLSPVLRAKLQEHFAKLSGTEVAFGEGDPVRTSLESIIDSLPKVVSLGEMAFGAHREANPSTNPLWSNAEARATAATRNTP